MHARKEPTDGPRWSMLALAAIVAVSVYAVLEWRRGESPSQPSAAELADPRAEVRIEALERVGAAWPAGARLAPLLPDLIVGDPDPAVQKAARQALASLRKPALAWYVQLLEDIEAERLPAVAARTREFDRLGVRYGGLLEALAETAPEYPDLLLSGLAWEVPARLPPELPHAHLAYELALLERWATAPRSEHEGLAAGLVLLAGGEARRRAPTPLEPAEANALTRRLMVLLAQTRHPPWMGWSVAGVLGALAEPAPEALASVERSLPAHTVRSLDRLRDAMHQFWGLPDEATDLPPLSAPVMEALADARVPDPESAEGKELDAYLDEADARTRWTDRETAASQPILLNVLRASKTPPPGGSAEQGWMEKALRALTRMPPLNAEQATIVEALQARDDVWYPLLTPLRLTLLARSERARPSDLQDLLVRLDSPESAGGPSALGPWWDQDLQSTVPTVFYEHANLALVSDLPSRFTGHKNSYVRLAVLEGLASIAPGPARDAAMTLVSSGELGWLEAGRRGEEALSQGKLRERMVADKGAIVSGTESCMSVLEALRVWGPDSGVPASPIAPLRDARNPRLAWRAHRAYRALGGT